MRAICWEQKFKKIPKVGSRRVMMMKGGMGLRYIEGSLLTIRSGRYNVDKGKYGPLMLSLVSSREE